MPVAEIAFLLCLMLFPYEEEIRLMLRSLDLGLYSEQNIELIDNPTIEQCWEKSRAAAM